MTSFLKACKTTSLNIVGVSKNRSSVLQPVTWTPVELSHLGEHLDSLTEVILVDTRINSSHLSQ